jgi:hypothetical protein
MSDSDNPFGSEPPKDPFGSKPPSDPFGRPASGDPFAGGSADFGAAPPPAAPPPGEAWRASSAPGEGFDAPPPSGAPRRADGAIPALVLGIIGLVMCPLCAPFAWVLGRRAERQVDASGGVLSGRGEATAGKILGIISCVLTILLILLFIAVAVLGTTIESGSDSGFQTF